MSQNPIVNALAASGYITVVATVIYFVSQTHKNKPDTFFAPVAMLSLLTLSAAVMAYLFFYQPLLLVLDGKKKQAVDLFLRTVGVFGMITVVIWFLLTSGLI